MVPDMKFFISPPSHQVQTETSQKRKYPGVYKLVETLSTISIETQRGGIRMLGVEIKQMGQ